jgi:RNA polymerase sigma factor (sigma-70 family)
MGNRKLIYRAVRRWGGGSQFADDMIGECQLVLIHAVAAYNPWLGVRFSTYAFTCLMRALSRMSQRLASDRLAHSLPLDALSEGEPRDLAQDEVPSPSVERLDEYLREGHTLLTPREKIILIRRFCLDEEHGEVGTLEQVGLELGLSKERVRQVQASALCKLRKAMLEGTPTS